jgi:hypothetical protein
MSTGVILEMNQQLVGFSLEIIAPSIQPEK